jgi:glycerol-3-phosphate dehydrogenase
MYDLLIIGGGIIGAGIARDAALRGMKVALFEKNDYGSGTTATSTRLIHGGLRYLEMLDFGLVREDLRERERLLQFAAHLVKPLSFLLPYYSLSAFERLKRRAGMILYDMLSFDKSLPRHRILSRNETLRREPGINPEGLQGAALYWDAQINLPERLCLENILDAQANGAHTDNYTEVTGGIHRHQTLLGLSVNDRLTGEEREVRGRLIVNASGAWVDEVEEMLTGQPSQRLRRTKGIHFAAAPANHHAIVLFSRLDGRLFFIIPWLHSTWVGTTDTDFDGDPADAAASQEEIEYLRQEAKRVMPRANWDTIYFTHAGIRALARENGKPPSEVSRKHRLIDHVNDSGFEGLITIVGGKLTAYRSIAQQAVNLAHRKLHGNWKLCQTTKQPLPAGWFENLQWLQREAIIQCSPYGLDPEQAHSLVSLYGARYPEILSLLKEQPELAERLHPVYPDIRAQVHHAVLREQCYTADDFRFRRTALGFTPDQGVRAIDAIEKEIQTLEDRSE